jgi:uncharacterized lipoprotein NlpE involved in copper resistance
MKKSLIALFIAMVLVLSGCYGSNSLFKKVHDWNGTIGDKWINSCVHFAFLVIPVYEITWVADILVLNTIEFWTGSNPVATGNTYHEKDAQGNQITAMKNADGSLDVHMVDAQGHKADLTLQRDADVIRALDNQGRVIAQYDAAAAQ